MASLTELGKKIKAKYPGAYDHIDDTDLGNRVADKYPTYQKQFSDAPKSPLPEGLSSDKQAPETSGAANGPGLPLIVQRGIHRVGAAIPAFSNGRMAAGTSDLIQGAGEVASPLAIPAMANPAAALGAAALGYSGGKAAGGLASMAGASPDQQELAENLGGIAGGAIGSRVGPLSIQAGKALSDPSFVREVMPDVVNNRVDAFKSAYKRAGATATPEVPFSVENDPRPVYGPPAPPPRVIRDAQSPAWASMPSPVTSPIPVPPIQVPAQTPSGRVPGNLRVMPPPEAIPLRRSDYMPVWNSVRDPEPLSVGPSSVGLPSQLPSGRVPGSPLVASQPQIIPQPLTNPEPPTLTPISSNSGVTQQYQPSRTKSRFDASGKRIGG